MGLLRPGVGSTAAMLLLGGVLLAAMWGCSPKKNTAMSRNYQAFITRYNIYFNGDEHFKQTLEDMEKSYADDYSGLLYMHPADAYANEKAPQPTGDFTRSIEKAQKAIQLRSIKKRPAKKSGKNDPAYKAWLKREEYNPFLHNAWMMMGRSQYYNGDYSGAASTFFYITKHFTWLPTTVTEAKLWQARCYCSMDWLFEAETILRRIKEDELTNGMLRSLYDYTMADLLVRSKEYAQATGYLEKAAKGASGAQKTRLYFLLGQVEQRLGNRAAAYEAYKKSAASGSASYRTKLNARIKQSEVYDPAADITPEVKALKRMTHYDRNKEYLDQIYYAIGNLYLSRRDTTRAIDNYELALKKSTRDGIDKAVAGLTLGSLYYDRRRYDLAQPCYANAVGSISEEYPGYDSISKRSRVLDELAVYSQNVTLQDSLLRLSAMTPEQQLDVVNKIIDELVKREREEAEAARREEYLAQQAAAGTGLQNNTAGSAAPTTFVQNNDKSWYFYNTATRNAGKTEFQKRWGSRKLEDDWRRRNKASFSFSDFDSGGDTADTDSIGGAGADGAEAPSEEQLKHEQDPHFPEYYLRQIPKTDAERATSNEVIQEGLYNMGLILKDKLEDFGASRNEFNTLLSRYPDNIYRLETYYNLYLMAIRSGNTAEAERLRRLIVDEFPESNYGMAMRDPNYFDNLRRMEAQQEQLYAQTYDDYLENRNDRVHSTLERVREEFPMSKILPKFMFLDALSYVTENNPEKFGATLREMLEKYPQTDMTDVAAAWLKGLAQGRKFHASASNMRGRVWSMRLSNDSTASDLPPADSIAFDLSPEKPQMVAILYPVDKVSPNQLLYDVAAHNFASFMVRDFDLEQMNFGNLGLLLVKGFTDLRQAEHYRGILESDNGPALPSEAIVVIISEDNFNTLLRSGGSFEQYFEAIGDARLQEMEAEAEAAQEGDGAQEAPDAEEMPDTAEETPATGESGADTIENTEMTDEPEPAADSEEIVPATPEPQPATPKPQQPATPKPQQPATPEPQQPATPAKPKPQQPATLPEGSEGDDDPLFQ